MPPPDPAAALTVRDLRKAFGRTVVLDGIDLDVAEGEIVAVLGPSGGGKTTLVRLIAGFEGPDAGTVSLRGDLVASPDAMVPPERRHVGIVPQEGALFPHLTVGQNVAFGVPRGRPTAARVAECLELVGLAGFESRRPHQLSGGQQQRVALARALAPHPWLVLLDEPFSSLDASLRGQVREDVFAALRRANATALLVTHDQQEALSVADRVAVLLRGRVAQVADPVTLYRNPADLAVATFVGEAVMVPAQVSGHWAESPLGRLEVRPPLSSADAVLVVRPEQVLVASGPGSVPARVRSRTFFGHDGMVELEVGADLVVRARVLAAELPDPGAEVHIRVDGPVSAFAVT